MKTAAVPGFRLSRSRTSTKVLTTLGLIGLLLGLVSASLLTISKTGVSSNSVKQYYLGSSEIDQSNELDKLISSSSARPFAELAEVTHLHLVGGSLLLFFLCHLLSVCEMQESTRTVLYVIAFTSFVTTFSLPWAIIYISPIFANVFGLSIVTFLITLIIISLIPIKEMWFNQTP